jgi:NAD(P)-dependent dehydrogenase (short-subunit alcohol dehydrogenase family)
MKGQVILVTGCSSGIGRATAFHAAERGHRVFASARRRTDLAELAERSIETVELDVTDGASVDAAVATVLGAAGRIDALVNNAGYGQYGAVEDVTLPEWRAQFEVNVFGAIRLLHAVLPPMREARKGTIVNVSSVAGKVTIPFAGPYCASKHALEAISDALRVEAAPWKIRVVVVEPGPIATHFGARTREVTARILQTHGPYSRFYANAERASEKEFQRGTRQPELVARVIVRAIESRRPKTRYRVAPMAKILVPLKRLASDRFLDRRLKRALKLPDSI